MLEQIMKSLIDLTKIKTVPTILHLENGHVTNKLLGLQDKEDLLLFWEGVDF